GACGWAVALAPGTPRVAMALYGVLTVMAAGGAVRLGRSAGLTQHHLFGGAYLAQMLLWNYPPTERFLFPLCPLLLAGLHTEVMHVRGMVSRTFENSGPGLRGRARVAATAVFGGLVFVVLLAAVRGMVWLVPGVINPFGSARLTELKVYSWIRGNLPAKARVLADREAVVYLQTGHRGLRLFSSTLPLYRSDEAQIYQPILSIVGISEGHGLEYLLYTDLDYHTETANINNRKVRELLDRNPKLRAVYTVSGWRLYRIGQQ
ncbi:MAG: hypothetical protein M1541_20115, partial [Acidobacteria bacterium]|nr:hypothetical protein [Acidobacteriota bacterium]